MTFLALLLVAAGCGGGGGNFDPPADDPPPTGDDSLALGLEADDPDTFNSTPVNDARLNFGSGSGRLPERVELRSILPDVDSQENAGSCVGWSTAYYLKTATEKVEEGWNVSGGTTNAFSPAFIYNQRPNRTSSGGVRDPDGSKSGMSPDDAISTLQNLGCCKWAAMPYTPSDSSTQPGSSAVDQAAGYRARDYRRFGSFQSLSNDAIQEIKGWLNDEGIPVTIGISWYESMAVYRGEDNGVVLDAKGGSNLGGHMITIAGYDDNLPSNGTGSFLLVNSHGTSWGDNGFAWVPYSELKRVYWVGYGVLDNPNSTPGPTPPPPPPPPQSNDTIDGAQAMNPANPTSTANGSVGDLTTDPADWWAFNASAGQVATVTLSGLTADADVKLTDANENRLGISQEWGTAAEEITYTIPTTGTYYVKVYAYQDAQTSYSLTVTLSSGGSANNNDSSSSPTTLGLNTTYNGSVGGSDPRDWWRMTLGPSAQVTVSLKGLAADIDLYVYRSGDLGGDWWLRSWNGGTSNESITFTGASGGATYYVLVLPYGSASSSYTLRADDASSQANLKTLSWNVNYTNFSDRVEVTVTNLQVKNIGTGASSAYKVGVGISDGTTAGSNYWLGSEIWVDNDGLPAGYTATWSSGSGSVSKSGRSSGWYYLLFMADSDKEVTEPNELDNFAFTSDPVIPVN